jgi:hypothetical protein
VGCGCGGNDLQDGISNLGKLGSLKQPSLSPYLLCRFIQASIRIYRRRPLLILQVVMPN